MAVRSYLDITDNVLARIRKGEITYKLPSQRAMCKEFGSSNRTVAKAMDVLLARGVIYSRPGQGLYVKKDGS